MSRLVRWSGWIVCAVAVVASVSPAEANVRLPKVIGSNMVLQREMEVPIWGWAEPGEAVTVMLGDMKIAGKADESGKWLIKLPPQKAGGPHELTVAGKNVLTLQNILFGEVWVCSGQSNMEWSVAASDKPQEEIANAKYPQIRLFHIARNPSGRPLQDVVITDAQKDTAVWRECSPATISGFSAVAYYFGRHLNKELNVPIGLINTSWGGTRIEPWTPPAGFEAVEATKGIAKDVATADANFEKQKLATVEQIEKWVAQQKKNFADGKEITPPPSLPGHPLSNAGTPTGLYNGMIYPIVPYAIRGAIWYQGESNLSEGMLYHEKMKALITGWRTVWGQGEFPFLFVQLAPYKYGQNPWDTIAGLWEAQTATLAVPNTGMAVTTDIGNLRDIHPKNKQDVGKRLALWALAKNYGKADVVYSGPIFKSAKSEGNKIRISYDYATGLKTTDGKAPNWFEVAGSDGKYAPAEAKIEGDAIVLSSADVSEPQSARYGWTESETPNLVNAAGLPAVPFRSKK